MRRFAGYGLASVLLMMSLLASAATVFAQAPVVDNPATPRDGVERVVLQEQWRLGGEDDDENFFGVIGHVFSDDEGNAYLVDNQLVEVQVYDPDGAPLNILGRRGDGPGEVRNLGTALLMPDGSLGLVQGFPGRVVTVNLDGTPGSSLVPGRADPTDGGFNGISSATNRGGSLVFSGTRVQRNEDSATRTQFLGYFGPDGEPGPTVTEKAIEQRRGSREASEIAEDFAHERYAVGPAGRIHVAPDRNSYRIEVYDTAGDLIRTFGRPYDSVKRTATEKSRAEDFLQPWRRRNRATMEFTVMDTEPDILRLHVTGSGETWVLSSRGVRDQQPGVMCTYDVFDPEGVFVRQAQIVCEGDGKLDGLFPIGDDRFLMVRGYADAMRTLFGMMADDEPTDDGGLLEIISYRWGS